MHNLNELWAFELRIDFCIPNGLMIVIDLLTHILVFFFIFTRGEQKKELIYISNAMNEKYATKSTFICIWGAVWHLEITYQLIDFCNQFLHYHTSNLTHHILGLIHCFRVEFTSLIRNWMKREKKMVLSGDCAIFSTMLSIECSLRLISKESSNNNIIMFFSKVNYEERIPQLDDIDWLIHDKTFLTSGFLFCSHSILNIWLLSCQFFVHHILLRIRTLLGANTPKQLDLCSSWRCYCFGCCCCFFSSTACQYDFGEASETNES